MKKLAFLAISILAAATAFAQSGRHPAAPNDSFASDLQTLPVVANTTGVGGAQFQSYVAILNPTSSSFSITASLFDATGTKKDAVITLAAGQQQTFSNFMSDVFGSTGGGAVRLKAADPSNRFIVSSEVRSGHYGTTVPALEFAGTSSPSFAVGITVDSTSRTNVGCFDQSGTGNTVKATIFDNTGKLTLGSLTLNLAPNAWGQAGVSTIVSGGYVQFTPTDNAVCYAVVVDNTTNDGRFVQAAEYRP